MMMQDEETKREAKANHVGFEATSSDCIHMTFVFWEEQLVHLQANQLAQLHQELQAACDRATSEADLVMSCFRPAERNLLIARFEAPSRLSTLRDECWEICKGAGVAQVDDTGCIPHCTLGKFRATESQASRLTCT